ncbi:hypothetical protein TCA2_1725 [Paenibacillus sp. TCA20]|nr:hypothetical protein TCA2_1725 [Paenibacillus sp. TCA20]
MPFLDEYAIVFEDVYEFDVITIICFLFNVNILYAMINVTLIYTNNNQI